MPLENVLLLLGIAAEAAFLVLLIRRRAYRLLPVFFSYIVWGVAGDSAAMLLRTINHEQNYNVWVVETFLDSFFQYVVLIELAWSVLRPMRSSLPKRFLPALALLIAAVAAAAWPLCAMKNTAGYPWAWMLALHAGRCFAITRIVFFLLLSACSQFLRIGWRDRELQVATGLGFYSLVSLAGTMIHAHQDFGTNYFYVELAVGVSYLGSLLYWVYSFAQQEAPRQAMTPEMESLLMRVAAAVRMQRTALIAPDLRS